MIEKERQLCSTFLQRNNFKVQLAVNQKEINEESL